MKRRSFLQTSSALSVPFLLNGLPLRTMAMPAAFSGMNGDSDRVLVIIQLNGGNDGLNTLVPMNSYDALANLRPNVVLPVNKIIPTEQDNAWHPSFQRISNLYDEGKVSVIQNVGYPNQNRSHFRSTDIWTTASSAEDFETTGWLGRYFENRYAGYPVGFPSDDCPDPFAMTVGYFVSETCQGISSNFSLAVNNPDELYELPEGAGGNISTDTCYGMQLDFVRNAIIQTNAYAGSITDAYDSGNNIATYPDPNGLANRLKTVAKLISGGSQTKVFIISAGGYDTHAEQVVAGATETGIHADLLTELSEAISAFQADLKALDIEERVVGMTFSEFGRQVRDNAGIGTDHGDAAPLFVFGSCVNSGIIGDNPDIPTNVPVQSGLPMQYDFRSVYGSILMDWFEVEESEVKEILYDDFQYIPILKACDTVGSNEETIENINLNLFPNPTRDWTNLNFTTESEFIKISLFDNRGAELKVITARKFTKGDHSIKVDLSEFAAGNYYIRLQSEKAAKTKSIVKL